MKPTISIIIPAKNEEKYIEKTLKSIKAQEFNKPFEIIVVDNESKDRTLFISKKYARTIKSEGKTIADVRNKGASIAKSDYFIFVDSDVILEKNYLSNAFKIFNSKKYVGFSGYHKFINENLKLRIFRILTNLIVMITDLFIGANLSGTNLCVSRKDFEIIRGFPNKDFGEDMRISFKLRKIGRLKHIKSMKVFTSSRRWDKGIIRGFYYYLKLGLGKQWSSA